MKLLSSSNKICQNFEFFVNLVILRLILRFLGVRPFFFYLIKYIFVNIHRNVTNTFYSLVLRYSMCKHKISENIFYFVFQLNVYECSRCKNANLTMI